MNAFSLLGKSALVTGAAGGIGREIALIFARAGADVILHDLAPTEAAGAVLSEIQHLGRSAHLITGDLGLPQAGRRLAEEALRTEHPVDILVLNASEQIRRPLLEIPEEEGKRQMQVNFHSSLEMIQTLTAPMKNRKWGRVLAIGSVQQVKPHPDMAVYAATKAALANLVLNLARQMAPYGITANTLAPGVIATARNAEALADAAYAEQIRNAIPLREFGNPADCAQAALLLCSEAGRYITGQTLYVDGGMSI